MERITIEWILLYSLLGMCFSAMLGVSGYLKLIAKLLSDISKHTTLADIDDSLNKISSSLFDIDNHLTEISVEFNSPKGPPDDWRT